MGRLYLVVGVVGFVLWVFCLIEVIGAAEGRIRHLPKVAWLLIVLFFPLAGSIAWLLAGRPQGRPGPRSSYERAQPSFPEYDRPGRAAAVDPERDEEFLRQLRARAEEQRRRYDEQRRAERDQPEAEGG